MIVFVGHSASGKDTLMNKVAGKSNLKPVISYTTRPIRQGEIDGIAYNFISTEEFEEKNSRGFFIEVSNYGGWLYGMAKEDCGKDRIVIVDPCGLRTLMRAAVPVVTFFIDVPERERLIRLTNRGDDITELCRRIISDRDTFRGIEHEVDYIVKNNNIEITTNNIIKILEGIGVN